MKILQTPLLKRLTYSKFQSLQKRFDAPATRFQKGVDTVQPSPHRLQVTDTVSAYDKGFTKPNHSETAPLYGAAHHAPNDLQTPPFANPAMPPREWFKIPSLALLDFKNIRYPLIGLFIVGLGLGVNWFLNRDKVNENTIRKVWQFTRDGKWDETNVEIQNPSVLTEGGKEQVVTRLGTLNDFFGGVHDNPTAIAQAVFNNNQAAFVTVYATDGRKLYRIEADKYLNQLNTEQQKAIINCTVIQSSNEQVYLKDINILEIPTK